MKRGMWAALFFVFFWREGASALLTTSTLPKGIQSPSFRFGLVNNVGEKYVEDGRLMNLGDVKSVEFDSATLVKMNAKAQKLLEALNSFGDHHLGDKFNFGVLRFHTTPQVRYFAPIFARGMSDEWTLALALPLITYQNKISITHDHSNLEYYRRQFSGLSQELDEALNTDLAQATNEILRKKGYRPLSDRDESFLGDTQVAAVYKILEATESALIYQAVVGLPTGPAYSPEDLGALNIFGRTSWQSTLAYSRRWGTSGWSWMPYFSCLLYLPDEVQARVPAGEDDVLPEPTSQEKVHRHLAPTLGFGSNFFYEFKDRWIAGAAYELTQKGADSFGGNQRGRYDLLARNTASRAARVKAELTYTSVKSYLNKNALLPLMLSLEVSDTIAGMNVERQLVQEVNLMLFF